MRHKSMLEKGPTKQVVKDIRRATRRHFRWSKESVGSSLTGSGSAVSPWDSRDRESDRLRTLSV